MSQNGRLQGSDYTAVRRAFQRFLTEGFIRKATRAVTSCREYGSQSVKSTLALLNLPAVPLLRDPTITKSAIRTPTHPPTYANEGSHRFPVPLHSLGLSWSSGLAFSNTTSRQRSLSRTQFDTNTIYLGIVAVLLVLVLKLVSALPCFRCSDDGTDLRVVVVFL